MPLTPLLTKVIRQSDLSVSEAREVLTLILSGEVPIEQSSGLLVALESKGVCCEELVGFAQMMRDTATKLNHDIPNLVDTCGTGGGIPSFNLSTGAAIVAASAGAKIAKHGNRSVTSKCGSADVLEALGVRLSSNSRELCDQLEKVGIAFLFAPHHHPAMKSLGPLRKNLGIRTIFNQLGPLANPASAQRQLIGVYDQKMILPMAQALAMLGTEHAFVVHGEDGLDEISACGRTFYAEVRDGEVREGVWSPSDFGFDPVSPSVLEPGMEVTESADILMSALSGAETSRTLALVPNSAVALVLSGLCATVLEGAQLALDAVSKGLPMQKLEEMRANDHP